MEPLRAGLELDGRFRLTRALGRGGMGEVWLAQDAVRSCPVALKFPDAGNAGALRAGFAAARSLVHPSIVTLHEMVEEPLPFLVMQYVEGTDIGALRGAGYRAILNALVPIAEALEYAHRQGVVHRDLKPANILRDVQGRCYIADFGTGAMPGSGSLPGMSPQQLDGAPPVAADDVYGFGSLLYELIAGQPLFHPQVTAERIRAEAAALPVADLSGERLPSGLRQLLGSLLQKAPERRPPGMGAVRDALEQVLRESPAPQSGEPDIRPVARARVATPAANAARGVPAGPLRGSRAGLPAPVVYGGIAALGLLAALVIFYLPTLVRERGPLVNVPAARKERTAPPAEATAKPPVVVPQAAFDAVLGEFLRLDEELGKLNADRWGGVDWAELRRLAGQGDAAYRERDIAGALASYQAAAGLAKGLVSRAPTVLADALREGEAALSGGDQAQAIARFETALAVAPDDAGAKRGLARARSLDRVLALMTQASGAEAAGERAAALKLYREAAALDPDWAPAKAGAARLEAAASQDAFRAQMARGFAAQAAGDLAAAREAFSLALRQRPDDVQARAALAQAESDQQLDRLARLQAEARALEQQERWSEAVARYEAVLAVDANLAEARQGRERARARSELDQRLRTELGNADRFNDDAALTKARAALESARAVAGPGPVLAEQIAELDRLLAVAATPVSVTIESDNMTEVTLFKVGRLGAFSSRSLQLRPGAYTAVGSRPGYRDVRRTFRVVPGSDAAPVVVRCEEPI
jgi:tetratricopeptide (TPR) repeat protein